MGIGISLFLIAIGAVLAWAVDVEMSGVDINLIGVIVLVVGVVGLLLTLLFWSSFSPFGRERGAGVVREREREVL
jgi:hypothetical protein